MSFSDPLSITYNSVAKAQNRNNQDNYGSEYSLDDSGNLMKFTTSVKHTIPARGQSGESHVIRLDVEHYDANLALLRVASSWFVIRTDYGVQDLTSSERSANALVALLTGANITKLAGRQN